MGRRFPYFLDGKEWYGEQLLIEWLFIKWQGQISELLAIKRRGEEGERRGNLSN